jgi:hypothetical protein
MSRVYLPEASKREFEARVSVPPPTHTDTHKSRVSRTSRESGWFTLLITGHTIVTINHAESSICAEDGRSNRRQASRCTGPGYSVGKTCQQLPEHRQERVPLRSTPLDRCRKTCPLSNRDHQGPKYHQLRRGIGRTKRSSLLLSMVVSRVRIPTIRVADEISIARTLFLRSRSCTGVIFASHEVGEQVMHPVISD